MRGVRVRRSFVLVVLLGGLQVATPVGAQGAPEEGAVERVREYKLGVGLVYADPPTGRYVAQRPTRPSAATRWEWRSSSACTMATAAGIDDRSCS